MPKPTDIAIREVTCQTEPIGFRTPIKFGGRVMTGFVVVNVTVVAETRDGRRGQGFGSMPMGNIWAWPSRRRLRPTRPRRRWLTWAGRLAAQADHYSGTGHPLEITHDLAKS